RLWTQAGKRCHLAKPFLSGGEHQLVAAGATRQGRRDIPRPGLVPGLPTPDVVDVDEEPHRPVWRRRQDTTRGYGADVRQRLSLRRRADWLLAAIDIGCAL